MDDSDLEALVTPKIKGALLAAIDRVGQKEFASLSGIDPTELDRVLSADDEYLAITVVSLACHINKTHGEPDPGKSSIAECLKGSIIRIPQKPIVREKDQPVQKASTIDPVKKSRPISATYDQKSTKILNFSANTIVFLISGYVLGGLGLSPLIGSQQCLGLSFSPLALTPCAGSVLGLVIGSIAGLGYTYYFFVKKM